MPKGMFRGVKDAKSNFGANYEREGHYIMFVRRVKVDQNRSKEWFVAVEKVCIECIDPGDEPKPHRPGEQCSQLFCNYGKGKDNFLPNLKAMIMNVFEEPEEEIDEDDCEALCSDQQPMACMFIEMQNKQVTTREGNPFTRIKYIRSIPYEEIMESDERVETISKFLSKDELAFIEKQMEANASEDS